MKPSIFFILFLTSCSVVVKAQNTVWPATTANASVGIGTTTPQSKLHIVSAGVSPNAASQFTGSMIIQGNSGGRNYLSGASLEFVIPANLDGNNPWGQARITTVAGNLNNQDATGKMILGTRRMFDKNVGTGYTWNYGDDLIIDGNGNIGIGTNPTNKLDVDITTNTEQKKVSVFTNSGTNAVNSPIGGIRFNWYGSNNAEIQMVRGYGGSDGAGLSFHTSGDGGAAIERMRIDKNGNVSIGTTDPKGNKLAVAGSIIATEVKVKLLTDWPDYVFGSTYRLPSLTSVKNYIEKNQHLPEMPSEIEVAKYGVNLGEIVKLQTKKIEELTLYLLEQQTRINKIEKLLSRRNLAKRK